MKFLYAIVIAFILALVMPVAGAVASPVDGIGYGAINESNEVTGNMSAGALGVANSESSIGAESYGAPKELSEYVSASGYNRLKLQDAQGVASMVQGNRDIA